MKPAQRLLWCSAALLSAVVVGVAQEKPDPRVGLKPGFRDAGQAAHNMELVSSLPKPEGFFDPKAPAGQPTPPERDPKTPPPETAGDNRQPPSGEGSTP